MKLTNTSDKVRWVVSGGTKRKVKPGDTINISQADINHAPSSLRFFENAPVDKKQVADPKKVDIEPQDSGVKESAKDDKPNTDESVQGQPDETPNEEITDPEKPEEITDPEKPEEKEGPGKPEEITDPEKPEEKEEPEEPVKKEEPGEKKPDEKKDPKEKKESKDKKGPEKKEPGKNENKNSGKGDTKTGN